ncbi:MAG TPA: hypothetical protein VLH79_13600 [Chthonomonadales bacterium]|nr:hypothetical protein [Chthonomonadales bacterium]
MGAALAVVVVPLWAYRDGQVRRTTCQSNLRRLSAALLLYAQDHNWRFPPPEVLTSRGVWRSWVDITQPYLDRDLPTICPANPATGAVNPYHGYPYPHSYALNARFYGVFAPGPFPIESLELPERTALLVESGRVRRSGPFDRATYPWAMATYWDTTWWPAAYPSPHQGRMNVAAADGHVVNVKVDYDPEGHDVLYGRIGRSMYNWNGGHPSGDTSGPARQ